jgi:hypothetical protein
MKMLLVQNVPSFSMLSVGIADGGQWRAASVMFTQTDCFCGTLHDAEKKYGDRSNVLALAVHQCGGYV